ncbi:MAG: hypothetical protein ACJASV_000864 [Pseudorhodobacter sp.]|jgi:hypothetical protein
MGKVSDAFQPMILSMVLVALGIGTWAGWELRRRLSYSELDRRSNEADIQWLRVALADSEQRCAAQSNWLAEMELDLQDAADPTAPRQRLRDRMARTGSSV